MISKSCGASLRLRHSGLEVLAPLKEKLRGSFNLAMRVGVRRGQIGRYGCAKAKYQLCFHACVVPRSNNGPVEHGTMLIQARLDWTKRGV